MFRMNFLPPGVSFALFRTYVLVKEAIDKTVEGTTIALNAVIAAFQPRKYYFLKGYVTPYRTTDVNAYASSSAAIEYIYDADIRNFNDTNEFAVTRYLPVLSLELIRDGVVIHDLTDFIESMTVSSDVSNFKFPSIPQIIAAWSIGSHIVFDVNIEFDAKVVSVMGVTYEFSCYETTDIRQLMAETDAEEEALKKTANEDIAQAKAALKAATDEALKVVAEDGALKIE